MQLRSVLFTPGDRPDRIEKAWANSVADLIVADLEDAVAPENKMDARNRTLAVVAGTAAGDHRAIRINDPATELGRADIAALADCPIAWVVVPKAESTTVLKEVAAALPNVRLLAILETAAGILNAGEIAALPAVHAVAFGAEDLAAGAGMRRSAENTEVAVPRSLVALHAAANRTAAIDMITADFRDESRFTREADEAVGLGYAGKMCLHPRQVALAHAAWMPSEAEIAHAQAIVDAAAGQEAGGVVVVNGKMVDVPLIRQSHAILERARSTD